MLYPLIRKFGPEAAAIGTEYLVDQAMQAPQRPQQQQKEQNPISSALGAAGRLATTAIGVTAAGYGAQKLFAKGTGERIAKQIPVGKVGGANIYQNISGTEGQGPIGVNIPIPGVGGQVTASVSRQFPPEKITVSASNPNIPGVSARRVFERDPEGGGLFGYRQVTGSEKKPQKKSRSKRHSPGQVDIDYDKNYTGSRKLVSDEMLAKAGITNTSATQNLSERPDVEAVKKKMASPKGVGISKDKYDQETERRRQFAEAGKENLAIGRAAMVERMRGENAGNNDLASINQSTNAQDNMIEQQVVPGTTMTNQYDSHAFGRVDQTAEALNTNDDFGAGFTSQVEAMGLGGYNLQPSAVRVSERGGLDTDMRLNPRYRLEKDPEATVQRGAIKSAIGKMEDDTATSFLRDFADSFVAAKGTQRFEGRA